MTKSNPIETLAAALHAACLRDLPEAKYVDRDWPAYHSYMAGLTKDEKREYCARERENGPTDFVVEKTRRPVPADVEVHLFLQVWGSTSLGYGGIGGQAITKDYTVVVIHPGSGAAAVYFGGSGKLAYLVPAYDADSLFWADLEKHKMTDVRSAAAKYGIYPLAERQQAREAGGQ